LEQPDSDREREKESGNRSLEKGKKGEVQLVLLLFLLVGRNANVCPPFTYKGAPKAMNSILQNRTFYFLASILSFFFSDGRIKSAPCKKK
jgi:hypothetical protein